MQHKVRGMVQDCTKSMRTDWLLLRLHPDNLRYAALHAGSDEEEIVSGV